MLQLEDVRRVEGMDVTDPQGDRIGKIDTVYLDNETDQPEFALVNTGLLGTRKSFVPLAQARVESDHVEVPHSKDEVKDAPNIDADDEISPEEEARIYEYYGLSYGNGDTGESPAGGPAPSGTATGEAGVPSPGPEASPTGQESGAPGHEASGEATNGGRGPVGRDVSGPTTDDAMTRSEEEVHVGKTQREAGRARLRKYVETEPVHERVQTRREEAHVTREPIAEENVDQATEGPEISEEEHEVTLHAEEPVVEKRAVPKERVRLETDEVQEEQEVTEEARKERIDVDEDPPA